jgi:hypothetical protein
MLGVAAALLAPASEASVVDWFNGARIGAQSPARDVALGVAMATVACRVATREAPVTEGSVVAALRALLQLAGSAMLVLALAEALRGWSAAMRREERRLRIGFVLVFGSCVLAGTLGRALGRGAARRAGVEAGREQPVRDGDRALHRVGAGAPPAAAIDGRRRPHARRAAPADAAAITRRRAKARPAAGGQPQVHT